VSSFRFAKTLQGRYLDCGRSSCARGEGPRRHEYRIAVESTTCIADYARNQNSVWHTATQKVSVSVFHHPSCSGEMRLPGKVGASRLGLGVDLKNDSSDLLPVGAVLFGIEQTQIDHQMLFVVAGQDGGCWRGVGNGRAARRQVSLSGWHDLRSVGYMELVSNCVTQAKKHPLDDLPFIAYFNT
jgi:hypothetical protein